MDGFFAAGPRNEETFHGIDVNSSGIILWRTEAGVHVYALNSEISTRRGQEELFHHDSIT